MKSRLIFVVVVLLATPFAARADTQQYLGLGEVMIPIDGASQTSTVASGQFFEAFTGTYFFFRVREGYEGELIRMGTPRQTTMSAPTPVAMGASAFASGDAAATEADKSPTVLGPYEIVGVYSYDTETGIVTGEANFDRHHV